MSLQSGRHSQIFVVFSDYLNFNDLKNCVRVQILSEGHYIRKKNPISFWNYIPTKFFKTDRVIFFKSLWLSQNIWTLYRWCMSQPQIYYLIRYVKHISHTEWRRRIKSSLLVCEKPKPKLSNWYWNKGKPLHTTIPSKPNKLFWDSKHSHVQPAPSAELKICFSSLHYTRQLTFTH